MKTYTKNNIILLAIVALFILGLTACGSEPTTIDVTGITETRNNPLQIAENKETNPESLDELADSINNDNFDNPTTEADILETTLSTSPDTSLSDIEVEGLLFMREEEKLARDVYITLYEYWNMNIFQNISASEQNHTDSIKVLLNRYGLDDPMENDKKGTFANPDLQNLYDQLSAQGSQSLEDALKVGAVIEEIDILDLEEYLDQTDNGDIRLVYENLLKGSRNHLRSFTSTIQRQTGGIYQPQYLSDDAFNAIIGSSTERGGNRGSNGRGKGNG